MKTKFVLTIEEVEYEIIDNIYYIINTIIKPGFELKIKLHHTENSLNYIISDHFDHKLYFKYIHKYINNNRICHIFEFDKVEVFDLNDNKIYETLSTDNENIYKVNNFKLNIAYYYYESHFQLIAKSEEEYIRYKKINNIS